MGKNILLGVSETAHKGKAAWIGVNGVARKWKAAWIGDANNLARQFFVSVIKAMATAAFERGGDGATTDDLHAYKSGSGYAVLSWPANAAFENCQKLTLHFYVVSNSSTFGTIALRSGTVKNDAYGKSASISSPIPDFTPTGTGWQSVDITGGLDASGGVERTVIAENGLKIFLRSNGNTVIGGIGGENCPYVTIDSAASEPDTPAGDVSFVVGVDGSVTLSNVAFTQLSDGSVQIDNATFTQQDDESVLIQ